MCAKNYQNRAWFDEVIAQIKWCSFLTHSVETLAFQISNEKITISAASTCTRVSGNCCRSLGHTAQHPRLALLAPTW